jgi:hypothetical protein
MVRGQRAQQIRVKDLVVIFEVHTDGFRGKVRDPEFHEKIVTPFHFVKDALDGCLGKVAAGKRMPGTVSIRSQQRNALVDIVGARYADRKNHKEGCDPCGAIHVDLSLIGIRRQEDSSLRSE